MEDWGKVGQTGDLEGRLGLRGQTGAEGVHWGLKELTHWGLGKQTGA